ncbi:hypothetical protein GZH47_04265 [Paenibacillus rhizovicinus]|uniref:Exosporium protein C n=1 Tax=Paenibacillus rhizovicinus TaxID=2704463 RepID=A0A6C0NVC3_9BACL|nr:hypothetical protein [Paenibacillus rhizovicinus]QHW30130.1 hypothetical protein GZH47_04265 [Paenibacillus rhizovicinus]
MPFSTGIVTNTRDFGTAASNIVVNARNLDTVNPVTVMVQIFASVDSDTFYTAYLNSFDVPANSYEVLTFFIAGNVAYEVQISLSADPPSTLMSVVGIDEFGNLVTDQQYPQSQLSFITALSPIM